MLGAHGKERFLQCAGQGGHVGAERTKRCSDCGRVCRQAQGWETEEGWRHAAVEVDNVGVTG